MQEVRPGAAKTDSV